MTLGFQHSVSCARHEKNFALSNFIEKTAHFIFLLTNLVDTKNIRKRTQ